MPTLSNATNTPSNSYQNIWSNRFSNRELIGINTGNLNTTGCYTVLSPVNFSNDVGAQITDADTKFRPYIYARNVNNQNVPTTNVFYKGIPASGLLDTTGTCITIETLGLIRTPTTGSSFHISHYLDYANSLSCLGRLSQTLTTGILQEKIQFQFLYASGTKYVFKTTYQGRISDGVNETNQILISNGFSRVEINAPLGENRINPIPVLGNAGLQGGTSDLAITYFDYRVYADRVDLDAGATVSY